MENSLCKFSLLTFFACASPLHSVPEFRGTSFFFHRHWFSSGGWQQGTAEAEHTGEWRAEADPSHCTPVADTVLPFKPEGVLAVEPTKA